MRLENGEIKLKSLKRIPDPANYLKRIPDPANYPEAITYPRPKIKQKSDSSSLKKIEEISVSNTYRSPV